MFSEYAIKTKKQSSKANIVASAQIVFDSGIAGSGLMKDK